MVLHVARARVFLRRRFGGAVGTVTRLGHGEWSKAYTFRHGGTAYVARFSALLEDFAKDQRAARYSSAALPIPRIVEVGKIRDVLRGARAAADGYYAISERAFGDYLDGVSGTDMRRLLPAVFAALDAARQVDLSDSHGYGGWGADGNAPYPSWREALLDVGSDRPAQRTYGWRKRLDASPTGGAPFDAALARLSVLVDRCPEQRHLIHSDLLHYNVLVSADRLTAVLDWGCALYGDFLYDVAWFAFWSPWYSAWQGIDFVQEATRHYQSIGLDVPSLEERLHAYQIHIGLGAQAYSAFTANWPDLQAAATRTHQLATRANLAACLHL